MTWSVKTQGLDEVGKCRWELVPYMRGNCIDLGCGPTKAFPHFWGVDSCKDVDMFGIPMRPDLKMDVRDLSRLASASYDLVFSSHTLEHLEDTRAVLKEWWRLVKMGGHMALYLPHADFYPRCDEKSRQEWKEWVDQNGSGFPNTAAAVETFAKLRRERGETAVGAIYAGTPFSNPDHDHDFRPQDIVEAMKAIGGGFDLVECEEREGGEEYSFWLVFKKISSGVRESWKNPKPVKTAAVVRYGAQGDNIQASSVLPWLKEQGYHVSFYCQSGAGHDVILHDPHIDRFVVQDKDAVPPAVLADFWTHERKKYDKWVNLCESVEGTLLAAPGRPNFEWPNALRAKIMDRNYLEFLHELAEVPPPYRPMFYSTAEEKAWAKKTAEKWGRKNILWSLAGSSGHKVWPHLDAVIAGVMTEYPDTHVVLVGDESCAILEQGWTEEPRVHCMSGKWTIRQSMAFAESASLIIGTETGLLNAAGAMDTWKIITLSHSSKEMLTKHWIKTIALEQPEGVGCPKSHCRQMHGGGTSDPWLDCPQHEETGTALCQFHIGPEMMWRAIESVLGKPVAMPERKAA